MFTRKTLATAVVAAGVAWLPQAHAHHALEYIDTSSYNITERGQGVAYLLYDTQSPSLNDPGDERWEFTPGISYGVTDWLMLDTHTHYAKFGANHMEDDFLDTLSGEERDRVKTLGASPMLEAVALGAQVALPKFNRWVDVGLGFTWEIPLSQAKKVLGDDEFVYEFELILHREFADHVMLSANIINIMEDSDHEQEWRLGMRMPISPDPEGIAAGLELAGSFEESQWYVMPGIYAPITPNAIAKMGFQLDGKEIEAHRFHASLMYIF